MATKEVEEQAKWNLKAMYQNEEAVNKFCSLAHKIISKDYVEELYKNTYAALLQLIRRT